MRCKVGDLAFITGGFPENWGKTVKVVKYINLTKFNPTLDWEVESEGGLIRTVYGPSAIAWIPDSCLMPIKPLSPEDRVVDKIKELTE